ncbi:MAG TPA: YbaY family lipoprotein [Syntrophobacteria bacterium]|nr:YbaY family lipoprotein [Syntrophobacteria bacterium]
MRVGGITWRLSVPALLLLFLSAQEASGQIQGTATYRERIALPPEAVFEATLEDVSRADAPATVVGRVRIDGPGQPPIPFEIPYDQANIDPGHSYSVRGLITVGGRLMFTTDQVNPVLTRGHGSDVALMLRRTGGADGQSGGADAPLLESLPASFLGQLPCADCAGIRYQLDLFPDQMFFLRLTYLGKGKGDGESFDDIGRWEFVADGRTLLLRGGREAPVMFAVKDSTTLRKLDLEGREIVSSLPYELQRKEMFQPVEPRLALRGMFSYFADTGILWECLTTRKFPVAQEGDNAALEAAYLRARRQPGEPLLVSVEGRLVRRPKVEGPGEDQVLVVERFMNLWPGESCTTQTTAKASLLETYWRPVEIEGRSVTVTPGQQEPHLILSGQGNHITGFTGCNRLTGRFEMGAEGFRFKELATTGMACLPPTAEMETAFLAALNSTVSQRIVGDMLELRDAKGTLPMRLEVRYLR